MVQQVQQISRSYIVRIWSPASITEIFAYFFTSGYNFAKSSLTKSWSSAANSTPVGPPPITTKWRFFFLSSSVRFGRDALSKHFRTLFLIFWASSTSWQNAHDDSIHHAKYVAKLNNIMDNILKKKKLWRKMEQGYSLFDKEQVYVKM